MTSVRAAGLRGLPALVDSLGGDSARLLAGLGLTAAAFDSDEAVISTTAAALLVEQAAAELHCPDLGLRLAERQDVSVLGPLAVAIENSATLGDALDCATRFLFAHSPALRIAQVSDPAGDPGVLGLSYTASTALPPQIADHGLGLFHRIILLLHDGPYGLRSVHLPHPPLAPVTRYTDFFGADVRFDRAAAVLRVPARLAAEPVRGGNQVLRGLALDYISSHYPQPHESVAEQVRSLLAQSLGSAPAGVAAIARQLRTHPRTLQRRLAAEGAGFEQILDTVRRDVAHRLITTTDVPLSQITAMVGLAEQSALSRAVRRWFGVTPRELRAASPR